MKIVKFNVGDLVEWYEAYEERYSIGVVIKVSEKRDKYTVCWLDERLPTLTYESKWLRPVKKHV